VDSENYANIMLNHCKLGEGLRVRVAFYFQQLASSYCVVMHKTVCMFYTCDSKTDTDLKRSCI